MIVVTNRIKTKKGFDEKMAPRFTAPSPMHKLEGFHKVEVLIVNHEDHDIMDVNMYWDTYESFEAWRNSDMFHQAHANQGPPSGESPILGSEIITAKVAATTSLPE